MAIYLIYIIVLAASLILLRFTVRPPDYIFRKLLHIVAFTSILPLVFCTEIWWIAVLVEIVFLIIVIIALHFAEKLSFYQSLFIEKGKHEVITSFIMLFSLITILMAVYWGYFGEEHKYIAVTAIMAWGPGDAAAAIIGKKAGKHKISGPHIEGTKSLEGTLAMGITSFAFTLLCLLALSGIRLPTALFLSLIIAVMSALVELFTKRGLDTVTVPIAASLILFAGIPFLHI